LLDARTIFKFKAVKGLRSDIPVVTDLVNSYNLAFLLKRPYEYSLMKKHNFTETPVFAQGQVYLSSIMDSLVCQAYYNPELITVLNILLIGI